MINLIEKHSIERVINDKIRYELEHSVFSKECIETLNMKYDIIEPLLLLKPGSLFLLITKRHQ